MLPWILSTKNGAGSESWMRRKGPPRAHDDLSFLEKDLINTGACIILEIGIIQINPCLIMIMTALQSVDKKYYHPVK